MVVMTSFSNHTPCTIDRLENKEKTNCRLLPCKQLPVLSILNSIPQYCCQLFKVKIKFKTIFIMFTIVVDINFYKNISIISSR